MALELHPPSHLPPYFIMMMQSYFKVMMQFHGGDAILRCHYDDAILERTCVAMYIDAIVQYTNILLCNMCAIYT